jgi:hypothetical protein
VDDKYFRENGLKVFLCTSPKTDIREVYRKKAFEEKKEEDQKDGDSYPCLNDIRV